jgi:hypothetical protein
MSDLATYSFVQANVNPLPNPPWTGVTGTVALKILSNLAVTTTANNDGWALHTAGGVTWPASQYSEVVIGAVGTRDFGPIVCGQTAWAGYISTSFDGTNLYIYEVTSGGAYTQVASVAGTYGAVGSTVYIEAQVSGANKIVKLFTGGIERVSYTDTTPLATGSPGLFHYDGTSGTTSWRGGDFVAAPVNAPAPFDPRRRAFRLGRNF